jgi:hypothetical protein
MAFAAPTQEEITNAIDERNSSLIARYALSIEHERQLLSEQLPTHIEAAANAKRDLDVCKAAIRHHDQTINLLQSVLRQLRP